MTLPLPDEAQADPQPSLLLEAADGRVFATRGSFRGVHVRLEDLPPYTADAVIAIEDRRFFEHGGIDPRGIMRAAWRDLTGGRVRRGRQHDHPAAAPSCIYPVARAHAAPQGAGSMLALWLERGSASRRSSRAI